MPTTLQATITGCSCAGVNITVQLSYNVVSQTWGNSVSVPCGSCGTLNVEFKCTGIGCASLNLNYNCCGETFGGGPTSCSCSPLMAVFTFTAVAQGGECCPNDTLTVTVTL